MIGSRQIRWLPLLVLLMSMPTLSAADGGADRPRIGVVLGGGGARGVAHIGVLQVLHRNRIPIDMIGGTSMGAIVGALFAMGLSPAEIEESLGNLDWDRIFDDHTARNRRTYRLKSQADAGFLPFEFGIHNWRIQPGRGLIAGQKFAFAFDIPAFHTAGFESFDRLAYPFRCVATDLRNGDRVVLDRGSLLQAVRASMSIPGLFPPSTVDGRMLVDGGLVWNVPVDMVREMGADIVIAVDVGARPQDTPDAALADLPGILEQTYNINLEQSVRDQLAQADHVIRIDLGDIRVQDFHRTAETIEPGRRAAEGIIAELAPYRMGEAEYAAHLAAHRPVDDPVILLDRIEIDNRSVATDEAIERALRHSPTEPLDLHQLQRTLDSLFDYGVFERVDFTLPPADGGRILRIESPGKGHAPWIILAGAQFSGAQDRKSELTAKLRLSRLELNSYGGQWRNDIQLGRIAGLRSTFRQPLSGSRRIFLSLSGTWREGDRNRYIDLSQVGEYARRDLKATLDLGLELGCIGEIRAGLLSGRLRRWDPAGGPPEFDGPRGGYHGGLVIDTFDMDVLPRRGFGAGLEIFVADPAFGSGLDYHKTSGYLRGAISRAENTFACRLGGGTATRGTPDFDHYTLGGLGRLSGFWDDQLRGRVFGLAGVSWHRRVFHQPSLFTTSWHLGIGLEAGNVWDDTGRAGLDDLRHSLNLSLTAKTWLGPATVAYGLSEGGRDTVYLLMGRVVDLLN